MSNPRGSIKCSVLFVAKQSRPIEPVFVGISGVTKTTERLCGIFFEEDEFSGD
jgi:hypothetical protein